MILEASDRIGGRIRKENFGGVSVELGAGWIAGVGGKESNPVWELAAQSGLRTYFSDYSNARYNIYDRRCEKTFSFFFFFWFYFFSLLSTSGENVSPTHYPAAQFPSVSVSISFGALIWKIITAGMYFTAIFFFCVLLCSFGMSYSESDRAKIANSSGKIFPSGLAADSYKKAVESAIQKLRNQETDGGGHPSKATEPPL